MTISTFQDEATLYIAWPHIHLQGHHLYPDGREEVVLYILRYGFNWQLHYESEEPLKFPMGSTITTIGHSDHAVRNRYKPVPDKQVYWTEES